MQNITDTECQNDTDLLYCVYIILHVQRSLNWNRCTKYKFRSEKILQYFINIHITKENPSILKNPNGSLEEIFYFLLSLKLHANRKTEITESRYV